MKKLLLSLLLFFVSIISFWYCDNVSNLITVVSSWTVIFWTNPWNLIDVSTSLDYWTYCVKFSNCTHLTGGDYDWCTATNSSSYLFLWYSNSSTWKPNTRIYPNDLDRYYCNTLYSKYPYLNYAINPNNSSFAWFYSMDYEIFYLDNLLNTNIPISDCPTCETCEEQYTSSQCQTEYSLIPISSVDSSYCITNWFCPSSNLTWEDLTWLNWSALYINNIQHLGKPIINITIPQEIDWDYVSTGDYFNLDVSGLNGDEEYIQGIIDINSYRPTSEDFTKTFVGGLTLIFPYVILALFIVFLRKLIKRIFK